MSELLKKLNGPIAKDLATIMAAQITRVCVECGRQFDMFDDDDAAEWHYGHDCEES